MATVVLAAAGGAIGTAVGGPVGGAVGRAIGAGIGSQIDRPGRLRTYTPPQHIEHHGDRLTQLEITTSREGAPLATIYGRTAVSGQIIWASQIKEHTDTSETIQGGNRVTSTNYSYSASFAISLGEGPIKGIGRVWLNEKLQGDSIKYRLYLGDEEQRPDSTIVAIEGDSPAYRGTAYIVFSDLDLTPFENRIPQIKVEVFGRSGVLEELIRGVNIIPASTEAGYNPEPVAKIVRSEDGEVIEKVNENISRPGIKTDWEYSLDQLKTQLPNCNTASLVVAWFGTDLRAGRCQIEPRVELKEKEIVPVEWSVSGLTRANANEISRTEEGSAAYGSTPPDAAVINAIRNLNRRGLKVVLYPFIMMDIPASAALPSPNGNGIQGAYPWRGRIVPETGQSVAAQISNLMGSATADNFHIEGGKVIYTGPDEWGYRRFILHLAALGRAAGGVKALLIGTELRGLTMASDTPGEYPFVDALKELASEVKKIAHPRTKISYAADWSEYHSHRNGDDVYFHLDSLWSDKNIDFIGIDNYLPLSDWRPGSDHADFMPENGVTSAYNLDYLKSNIEGGEYWNWYYASYQDRVAQIRTPIQDYYGEEWVFRQKAIRDWHSHTHHNRPDGIRESNPTSWIPNSKPIWFTELGCSAVELGSNQPNVFASAKSSENALPYFSGGIRDDFMQRQYLRASLEWWRDNGSDIVSLNDVQIWAWDARPWPEFPRQKSFWSDGEDWQLGHWLNGRMGVAPIADMIADRLQRFHGSPLYDVSNAYGQVSGYEVTAPLSFREFFTPLEEGLDILAFEGGGKLHFSSLAQTPIKAKINTQHMIGVESAAPFIAKRSALEDVTAAAVMRFKSASEDYKTSATRAGLGAGSEEGILSLTSPLILDFDQATAIAERIIRTSSEAREELAFSLPRSATDIRAGVVIPVALPNQPARLMLVRRVIEGEVKRVEASSFALGGFAPSGGIARPAPAAATRAADSAIVRFLDIPAIYESMADNQGWIAAHASPWSGLFHAARNNIEGGPYGSKVSIPSRSILGETVQTLNPSLSGVWVEGPLEIHLYSGSLVGREDQEVLRGANRLALQHSAGWEILGFREAELIGANRWRLNGLLRGLRGTEAVIDTDALPSGANIVILDGSEIPLALNSSELGVPLWFRSGKSDIDPTVHQIHYANFEGVNGKQFAPAHLKAKRLSNGSLEFSWMARKTGFMETFANNGESLQQSGAPERWRIQIGPPEDVKRALEVTQSSFEYSMSAQLSDALTPPYPVSVTGYSSNGEAGYSAEITIR